jgi:hypothetical protein
MYTFVLDFPTLSCICSSRDITLLMLVFLHNVASDAWLMFLACNFLNSGQDVVLLTPLFLVMLLVMLLLHFLHFYPLANVPMHL